MICLSKCKQLLGSPWSSFTEIAARFHFGIPSKSFRNSFQSVHMASFQYVNSCNIGDNIQSIVAQQFYKQPVRYLIDRDQTKDFESCSPCVVVPVP